MLTQVFKFQDSQDKLGENLVYQSKRTDTHETLCDYPTTGFSRLVIREGTSRVSVSKLSDIMVEVGRKDDYLEDMIVRDLDYH